MRKSSRSNLPVARIPPLLPASTVASLGSSLQHPLAPCLRASATFLYLFSPALKLSHLPQLLIFTKEKARVSQGSAKSSVLWPRGLPEAVPPSLGCSASLPSLSSTPGKLLPSGLCTGCSFGPAQNVLRTYISGSLVSRRPAPACSRGELEGRGRNAQLCTCASSAHSLLTSHGTESTVGGRGTRTVDGTREEARRAED